MSKLSYSSFLEELEEGGRSKLTFAILFKMFDLYNQGQYIVPKKYLIEELKLLSPNLNRNALKLIKLGYLETADDKSVNVVGRPPSVL